jgi:hypothetical protein
MLRKLLGFDRMHENKTFVFCFLKEKINLKILRFFFNFQKKNWKPSGENQVF